jgi:hypothetical protein
MLARLFAVFAISACFGSAASAETWDCTIHASPSMGLTETRAGHVQIQVVDADILWITPSFTVLGKEYPSTTQRRHIVLNNDVGLVAVFGLATTTLPKITIDGRSDPAFSAMATSVLPNPRVEAYATVLDKHNGALRVGSVGTTAVSDIDTGECVLSAPTDLTSPPNPK